MRNIKRIALLLSLVLLASMRAEKPPPCASRRSPASFAYG